MPSSENRTDLSEAVPLKAATYTYVVPIDTTEPPDRKLLRRGPAALASSELLAVISGAGRNPECLIRLFQSILKRRRLERLPDLGLRDWLAGRAIGKRRAVRVAAALEFHKRLRHHEERDLPVISGPREAFQEVRDVCRARKEHLVALYLDAQDHLFRRETVSIGRLNTTRTHPREILQPAIVCSAMGFMLAHNHPSGSLAPSQEDIDFTRAIRRAAEIVGIALYDHLIISGRGYLSIKERGLL